MTHSSASRGSPVRRLALASAILFVAASGHPARAGTIRMVTNGSDSVSAPAAGSLRKVLTEVQPGDTIRFAQNFSIVLDRKDPNATLKLAQSGVTIEGPAELRSGLIVLLGDATTVTGMRFADFRVFAGTLTGIDPNARTADFVFRGNTLVGDAGLQLAAMSNAVVEDNTFDVRAFRFGTYPAKPNTSDTAVGDYNSTGSRWIHNTWTDTSLGGFEEADCTDLLFDRNTVYEDVHFRPKSGVLSANVFKNVLWVFHFDGTGPGTLTIRDNTCGALGADRPSLEVVHNTVTGIVADKWRVAAFSASSGRQTGDAGFLRVVDNTVTATQGWITGLGVTALAGATECLVTGNTVTGGKLKSLSVTAANSALVSGNTVKAGGKTAAIWVGGDAAGGIVLESNVVEDAFGDGIQIAKGTGAATLTTNTVSGCKGAALRTTGRSIESEDGTYRDCGAGVAVGKKTSAVIRGGSITGNRGSGVYADAGASVEVVRTAFTGNAGAGIDLAPIGVTPNSKKKKANGNVPYPATLTFDDTTGRVKGKAEPLARIDVWAVETGPRAGNPKNGEGETWLGETFADANGDFAYPPSGRVTCPASKKITLTATRLVAGPVAANVTSEFSEDVDCGGPSLSLVDRAVDGTAANLASNTANGVLAARYRTVSEDGRFVVFTSRATNLLADDTNGVIDVFLRDTVLGTTTRVNRTTGGAQVTYEFTQQSDAGSAPSISADGRFVCYTSRAENSFDDAGHWYFNDPGVILYDTQTGTNTVVASPLQLADPLPSGTYTYGGAYYASVSGDGSAVIFTARGEDYVTGDAGDDNDAFVWTRATGAFERVSVPTGGGDVTNGWQESNLTTPRLSHDARFAVFASTANLSGTTIPFGMRPWIRDRQAGTTEAVCVDGTGAIRSGYDPWTSDDGRFVVFYSYDSLVPADTGTTTDVYLRDRQTGTTTLVSAKPDGTNYYGDSVDPCISGDGRFVTFRNFADVWLLDRQDGTKKIVSGSATVKAGSYCYQSRLSRTGQFLVFETDATNLADLGGQSFISHVYLRDLSATGK